MTIEDEIAEYEKKNGIELPAHNKATLRSMIEKENRFWDKEAVREDSHSPVGDWNNAKTYESNN